jgi:outer membrane immunogenic protein
MWNRVSLATIAVVVQIAGPAMAADLPVGPPVYAPARATPILYSWWNGCYVGVNAGGAWSRIDYAHDNSIAVENFHLTPAGYLAGGQAGCQYQLDPWGVVLGIEGAWSATHLNETNPSAFFPGSTRSITIDQIATVTGRVGYAWDRTMVYLKAGWAGVRVNAHASTLFSQEVFDFTQWSSGWTLGGGAEYVIWRSVVLGAEFNYYNAKFDHSGVDNFGVPRRNFNTNADLYSLTLRLSYLFGPPVVTNY